MRAPKLVQVMKGNSSTMASALVSKIRASGKCGELLRKVPESEQKTYASEIFQDLTEWLGNEMDSVVEVRYVDLGIRRAGQGVPQFEVFWAVCIARQYLWDYVQQECLQENPVEFLGGAILLRSLNDFFDRILYCALLGYERAKADKGAALSLPGERRSA